ncbi:MAG: hypothetical protein KME28_26135 [Pelatocladus maniniholoensis HA4357-MV3]|jgi:hypothetical protein|uniref:Uncharacterized protein n=1 Tax=Pelatocladus maniniholoensis HA4357-MV3 TaxID=1117104 RepID=A0A9E3HDD0_9NOST|nr:hypothetical protein [Pelatocladus maniniholoensis HA4357-MV3]
MTEQGKSKKLKSKRKKKKNGLEPPKFIYGTIRKTFITLREAATRLPDA